MRWIWIVPVMLLVGTVQSFADEAERLSNAATVLQELRATPDKDVPAELWEKAACVGVIPSVKKAAFMFGGEYGRGVMSCRQSGRWSVPMFLSLEKGSWGFQAGAESIDLVLVFMNRGGVDKLLANKVSLGADASAAAGPVGRSAHAATDAQMKAQILSVLARTGRLCRREYLRWRTQAGHRCEQGGLRRERDPARHSLRHNRQAAGHGCGVHERPEPEYASVQIATHDCRSPGSSFQARFLGGRHRDLER